MECGNCGNEKAYGWRVVFSKDGNQESCNRCSISSFNLSIPDVYWSGPGYNRSIVDSNGRPIFLETRAQKARVMKEQNLREAGDMYHGSRGTEFEKVSAFKSQQMVKHREDVKRAGQIFRQGLKRLKT